MNNVNKNSLIKHKELKGKIKVEPKRSLLNKESLSLYYTPGVGAVSKHIHQYPKDAREYTWINNSVAVVSDGSSVLGLGDIGPKASLPVMEGKCMIFKQFSNIDAVPIVLDVHSTNEIVETIKAIAPGFGGINLEDIAAPKCFEIESRLKKELNIPVMHDDQHGTAIVVLAGLINACKLTKRNLGDSKIVISGAGAAGTAIVKLLHLYAKPEILAVDSQGIVCKSRKDLNQEKRSLLKYINSKNLSGSIEDALKGADIFIGVSRGNLLNEKHIKLMSKGPIVFALANPIPEIMPDVALKSGAEVVATGRSDFNNQINNALVFPGIFRGALDNRVNQITDKHKITTAQTIANMVNPLTKDCIIPSIFDKNLVKQIANKIV